MGRADPQGRAPGGHWWAGGRTGPPRRHPRPLTEPGQRDPHGPTWAVLGAGMLALGWRAAVIMASCWGWSVPLLRPRLYKTCAGCLPVIVAPSITQECPPFLAKEQSEMATWILGSAASSSFRGSLRRSLCRVSIHTPSCLRGDSSVSQCRPMSFIPLTAFPGSSVHCP